MPALSMPDLRAYAARIKGRLFPPSELPLPTLEAAEFTETSSDVFIRFPTYGVNVRQYIEQKPDYVRNASIALAIKTIRRCGVAGDFAEVGVYRGATSRLIHSLAPDRVLYLFDTFEGFPTEHVALDGNADDSRFRDTSIELVLEEIGDTRNVRIRKGIFPETEAGLEGKTFAFVLLDLDLHYPTLAGLRFFYPRLAPGAYVFVHDFNSPESRHGSFRAVTEFLADKPEKMIELPDIWGSAVFRKT